MPAEGFEDLSDEQEVLEKISLGLRTKDGIGKEDLEGIAGAWDSIRELETSGHVTVKGSRVVPTKKGLLIADQLPLYIIR